jgi:hypothetical protein
VDELRRLLHVGLGAGRPAAVDLLLGRTARHRADGPLAEIAFVVVVAVVAWALVGGAERVSTRPGASEDEGKLMTCSHSSAILMVRVGTASTLQRAWRVCMYSILYIIGAIVVIIVVLKLLGLY